MCLGGCTCPQPLPPPSQQFNNFRLILKGLALGLLILMVFNFVIINIMGAIYTGLLIYFLYLAWTQFNFCSVLFFFIFCCIQTVTNLLGIIERIEHKSFFNQGGMETFASVVVIIGFVFYGTSLVLSHYIYKHFKNHSGGSGQQGLMGGLAPIVPGQGYQAQRNQVDDRVQNQRPPQQPQRNAGGGGGGGFRAFQGQGVAIG